MASHVIGPFHASNRPLDDAERTTLDETAVWTFDLLAPPPVEQVTHATLLRWRVRHREVEPPDVTRAGHRARRAWRGHG